MLLLEPVYLLCIAIWYYYRDAHVAEIGTLPASTFTGASVIFSWGERQRTTLLPSLRGPNHARPAGTVTGAGGLDALCRAGESTAAELESGIAVEVV